MHKTHGKSNTKLYRVWRGMLNRCYNKNVYAYKDYGARGITVQSAWVGDYQVFHDWAYENGYQENKGLSIDRKDNDGNYTEENCRIVDRTTQANNTRANHCLTYDGKTQTIAMWAKELEISPKTLQWRLSQGKPIEEVLTPDVRAINRILEFNGKSQSIKEWAKDLEVEYETLSCRLRSGWNTEKTLNTPVKLRKPKSDRMTTFRGKTQPLSHWARELGINNHTLWNRVNRGWSVERALSEPVKTRRNNYE